MNRRILSCLLSVLLGGVVRADVKPAALFSDHMVLQQGSSVPVWGWADAGEQVTVGFAGQKQTATTGADGKWMVRLGSLPASAEPQAMTIAGKNSITINDVLVGEVWIASGQSNMQFVVGGAPPAGGRGRGGALGGVTNAAEEVTAANYPKIRMITPASAKTYEPVADITGQWLVCSPETVSRFSAAGYFFARDIHKELNVPVGIVTVAFGASCAEAWISRETMAGDPVLKKYLDSLDAAVKFFKEKPDAPGIEAPQAPRTINTRTNSAPARQRDPVQDQHYPTVLFNGMVAPLVPYAIRGAIWYQGESIIGGSTGLNEYGYVHQALIKDWRKLWKQELPFYIVQLPGQENVSNSPRVREEQEEILSMPKTGMAVTIDTGERTNVHPANKAPAGNRLARLALAQVYGKSIEFSGPKFDSMRIDGNAARVRFTHAAGMQAKGGELKGFAIAGADKKFVNAAARIEGDSVVVSSPEIASPVAVRYAWYDFPEGAGCNLLNGDGLPAGPFRTDKWEYPVAVTESEIGVTYWPGSPTTQPKAVQ